MASRPESFASRIGLVLILLALPLSADDALAQGKPQIELVPQISHVGWIRSVAFSRDGIHVLSGGADKTVKLWEAATGQLIRTFGGHSGEITSIAFSSDGTWFLSGGSNDKTLKLWDPTTGRLVRVFEWARR